MGSRPGLVGNVAEVVLYLCSRWRSSQLLVKSWLVLVITQGIQNPGEVHITEILSLLKTVVNNGMSPTSLCFVLLSAPVFRIQFFFDFRFW